MRRMYALAMMIVVCSSSVVSAVDYYEAIRTQLVRLGDAMENTNNVPVVDNLTNLLPFAAIATCLKKCPGQTALLLAMMVGYSLSRNDSMRSLVKKWNPFKAKKSLEIQANNQQFDDSLFVFEGETPEDAQEEEDTENDLLNDDFGDMRRKHSAQRASIKFI